MIQSQIETKTRACTPVQPVDVCKHHQHDPVPPPSAWPGAGAETLGPLPAHVCKCAMVALAGQIQVGSGGPPIPRATDATNTAQSTAPLPRRPIGPFPSPALETMALGTASLWNSTTGARTHCKPQNGNLQAPPLVSRIWRSGSSVHVSRTMSGVSRLLASLTNTPCARKS
jgi:hypothetical protein